jgi:PIN domain nuclease of toxin-antitoxin system
MRLLLDTHIVIWALSDSARLTEDVLALLYRADTTIHVSAASIWEIGLKHQAARRTSPAFGAAQAMDMCDKAGYALIPITAQQTAAATTLPPIHGDPFDRLLVAQALDGPYRLITRDPLVSRYSDTIILMK